MIQPELVARLRLLVEAYRLPLLTPLEAVSGIAPVAAAGEGKTRSEVKVSEAGRLVARNVAAQPHPGDISTARPVLPDAPLDAPLAAATLRELVALSGLFYESHQAEWLAGGRDTAQLRLEPQNQGAPAPIEQQINALETRQLQWSGQIWPGQPMRWEISERETLSPEREPERRWQTTVELDLPNLGLLHATLSLSSTGLAVTI